MEALKKYANLMTSGKLDFWPPHEKFYNDLINLSELEISFEVMKQFVGKEINSNKLIEILEDTISFDFPLIKLSKNIYTLELFHGPTMAFKDVGARFMSRCDALQISSPELHVASCPTTRPADCIPPHFETKFFQSLNLDPELV